MRRHMFRWLSPCIAVLMLVGYGVGSGEASPSHSNPYASLKGKSLVIASWGGVWTQYGKQFFADPFAKATGVNVTYVTVGEGFAPQITQQEQTGSVQWDVIDGGGQDVWVLHHRGYLQNFPKSMIKVLTKLSRPGQVTSFNLDYGDTATMIACNPAIMKKCPTNAKQFWDVKHYPGPRAINDNAPEAMLFAEQAGGVSPKHLFPLNINLAIKELKKIKPSIKVWPSSGAQQQQVMIDGEVGASIMWNGRAFTVKRDNIHNLRMEWGSSIVSSGGLAIPKGAPDTAVAQAYIKWVAQHPNAQAQWTKALSYPTPTKKLLKLLPKNIARALPAAHHSTQENGNWLAAHSTQIEKAWQGFITG